MRCLERSRGKFVSVQQYEHAAEKCKEVATLREEKRKLQLEMAQLQKLEATSMKYHSSTKSSTNSETCNKKSEEDPRQRKLLSFLGGHKNTEHVEEEELIKDDENERDTGNSSYTPDDTHDWHTCTVTVHVEEEELEKDKYNDVNFFLKFISAHVYPKSITCLSRGLTYTIHFTLLLRYT